VTARRLPGAVLAALLSSAAPVCAQSAADRLAPCLACHGSGGWSRTPDVPSLGGQPAFYVITQLFLFREGRRGRTAMTDMARGLSDDDLRTLSSAIAALAPPPVPAEAPQRERFERGRERARELRCPVCHGADYAGGEQVPRLANQREDYLVRVLREFKSGARLGYTSAMAEVLVPASGEDLSDVAHYLAYLPTAAASR